MVYTKEERNNHWEQILQRFFDYKKGVVLVTTNDLKSVIKDKEIRLLLYFDSEDTMPEPLRENQIMLFPNTTKSWWLVKCEGFLTLQPITSNVIYFKSRTVFDLLSSNAGMGEQQYLLNMVNSGILKDFLKTNNPFYFSIMGKQRSKDFNLEIDGHSLKIENPGIEIDAGFEGNDFAVVVEAKAKIISRINKRQLYFPYMHVKRITGKETIPIFFCWDPKTKTYNLWKFKIQEDNIEKIILIDSKKYSLHQSKGEAANYKIPDNDKPAYIFDKQENLMYKAN